MYPLREEKRLLPISLFQLLSSLFLAIYFLFRYLYSKPPNYVTPPISAQIKPAQSDSATFETGSCSHTILVQLHCFHTRLTPMIWLVPNAYLFNLKTQVWEKYIPKTAFITPIPSQNLPVPPSLLTGWSPHPSAQEQSHSGTQPLTTHTQAYSLTATFYIYMTTHKLYILL